MRWHGAYRSNQEEEEEEDTDIDEEEELRADRPQIAAAMDALYDITCLLLGQSEESIPEGHILQLAEEEGHQRADIKDAWRTWTQLGLIQVENGIVVGVCMQDEQF